MSISVCRGDQNMSMLVCQRHPGSNKVLLARPCHRTGGVIHVGAETGGRKHSSPFPAGSQERKLLCWGSTPLPLCKSPNLCSFWSYKYIQRRGTFASIESRILKITFLVLTPSLEGVASKRWSPETRSPAHTSAPGYCTELSYWQLQAQDPQAN